MTEASDTVEKDQSALWEKAIVAPGILVERKHSFLLITLNRPEKKNAFTMEMFKGITEVLNISAKDDTISFVAFTGKGEYYSSGIDLASFVSSSQTSNVDGSQKIKLEIVQNFFSCFIEFPKPLVALVNGPAVGAAATVLGLFDLVYAAEKATFQTLFTALGISPEGCSTYTFPKIMGYSAANRILMLCQKISAVEAKQLRLVCEVYPDSDYEQEIEKRLLEMSALPKKSLAAVKQETRFFEIETLRKVNVLEMKLLEERICSEDCQRAVAKFFNKKKSI